MRFALTLTCIILVALIPEASSQSFPHYQVGFFESTKAAAVVPENVNNAVREVVFIGDVLLARRIETLLDRYGSDYVYQRLPVFNASTTYVVANFESAVPINHQHTPDLTFSFSVDAAHLGALRTYGVTHASLANNHSYDAGVAGFSETVVSLNEAAIVPFGDQRIATSTLTEMVVGEERVVIAGLYAVDTVPDYVALARQLEPYPASAIKIAYIHWGTEYAPRHGVAQERTARELVALGFNAIIGHHPHVVQDIQLIEGVPVFYSLGNFVFDQYFSVPVQQGLMVTLEPTPDALRFTLEPTTSVDVHSQPRLMDAGESASFLRFLAGKSSASLAEQIADGVLVLPR